MAIRIDWSVYPDRERRAAFTDKLIPESPYRSAGVPVPEVRRLARSLDSADIEVNYIEDILLIGIITASRKESFAEKRPALEAFFPYLVSWMATDVIASSLYVRKKDEEEAYHYFLSLTSDSEPMVARFAVVNLLSSFLTAERRDEILSTLLGLRSDHYLLSMGIAWLFSVSYVKWPEESADYLSALSPEIRKLAKQKCRDSRRLTPEARERLKML